MTRRTRIVIAAAAAVTVLLILTLIAVGQSGPTISAQVVSAPDRPGPIVRVTGTRFPASRPIYVGLVQTGLPPTSGTTFATTVSDANGGFTVDFPYPNDPHWTSVNDITVYAGTPEGDVVATTRLLVNSFAWMLTPSATATVLFVPVAPATFTPTPVPPSPTPIPPTPIPPTPLPPTPIPPTRVPPTPVPPTPPSNPAISLQPASGNLGTTVVVNGLGWRPGEPLLLGLMGAGSQPTVNIGTITADARGGFSTAFVFPTNWAGPSPATVAVQSLQTGQQTIAFFAVNSPPPPTGVPPTAVPPTGVPPTAIPPTVSASAWQGQYFDNVLLAGSPAATRNDNDINFGPTPNWLPTGVAAQHFSVRWNRSVPFADGPYTFTAQSNGGVRVWLDNNLVIDQWAPQPNGNYSQSATPGVGLHTVRVEYFSNDPTTATIHVAWQQGAAGVTPTATP